MPNLHYHQLQKIVPELKILENAFLQKVHQPGSTSLLLKIRGNENYKLYISLDKGATRCHLTQENYGNPKTPFHFCQVLRKYIQNGRIVSIELQTDDRVITFCIARKNEEEIVHYYLICELWANKGNIYLTDHNQRILGMCQSRSPQKVGEKYNKGEPLLKTSNKADENFLEGYVVGESSLPWNEAADKFYQEYEATVRQENEFRRICGSLQRGIKKLQNKYNKLKKSYEEAQHGKQYSQWGELLKGQLYQLKKGMKEASLVNYFSSDAETVKVPLDPKLSPLENMERYFKKYRKSTKAIPILEKEMAEIEKQLIPQRELLEYAEQHTPESFFSQEIPKKWQSVVSSLLPRKLSQKQAQNTAVKRQAYYKFISKNDWEILVGKGAKDNDELTFSIAKGNDLWLHAEDYPGSHVIVRMKQKQIPQETLLDACQLTAHYSKAKGHNKVSIAYTQRKHINKPKKAKPGLVYMANKKTIFISYEQERLERLMATKV